MTKNDSRFKIENNILKGIEVPDVFEYASLGEFILKTLEKDEDFVGQVDVVTGKEYTYGKMRERSVRCALWMQSQGLLPGDVVSICSNNHMDVAMPCFAALYLGAVLNSLDAAMSIKEILHLMNITKPKLAFVSEESARSVAEAAKEAQLDLKIIVFGKAVGFLDFGSIIAEPEVEDVKSFQCTPIKSPRETAIVVYSSGTTGLPKGVAHSSESMFTAMFRTMNAGMSGYNCLIFSSLYWITGILFMLMHLLLKVTRHIPPPFEEFSAGAIIEKYKINWIFLSPNMVHRLWKSGALEKYNFSHVKCVLYAGSPLASTSRTALANFMPNALIISGYGLTEIAGFITLQTINSKPESCGHILENSQLKVVDTRTGRLLGINQKGEFLLKTPSMMSSYYDNPQATAEVIEEEGWLHTGDLGYYNEDGEVFIVDRLKDLILYRDIVISPFEIETVMLSHPGVKEVAVVGIPHPFDDEHPVAFVVRAADYSENKKEVTEIELIDLVASTLSDSKQLRGGVRFVDSLPKSSSGKIRRKQLCERTAEAAMQPTE